jgi:dihydropteroate synthase
VNNSAFVAWCDALTRSDTPPLVVGILNVTCDSFSDGGHFLDLDRALHHAKSLIHAGCDIIDVGGESSRPGALPIALDEELSRVIPVIEGIRAQSDVVISIDTYKPAVMCAAVVAGASIINDIMALQAPGALDMAVSLGVSVCLMHMPGTPQTMQQRATYPEGVVAEIDAFFTRRIEACVAAGLPRERLMLDPGFGFGKTDAHNLQLTQQLNQFVGHNLPLWFGCSRKSTLGAILDRTVHQRLAGGLSLAVFAVLQGARLIRTHDVFETRDALTILNAVRACKANERLWHETM